MVPPEQFQKWFTAQKEHNGQLVFMRVRSLKKLPALTKGGMQYLIIVKLILESVSDNGLPTPDYNDSLAPFDSELIDSLDEMGQFALVETCGGRRIYYAYIQEQSIGESSVLQISQKFDLNEAVTVKVVIDGEWKFYETYCSKLNIPID